MKALESIPDVVDVTVVRGAAAAAAAPSLLIEIPHGATRTAEYDHYARQLTSPLPPEDEVLDQLALVASMNVADELTLELTMSAAWNHFLTAFEATGRDCECGGLLLAGYAGWISQVEHRVALGTELDTLVPAGQESAAPLAGGNRLG